MKNTNIFAETLKVSNTKYVYRVEHRIMEGDCDYDHGPREVEIKDLEVSTYPVTNSMFKIFVEKTKYCPQDTHNYLKLWKNGKFPLGEENCPVVWVSQKDAKAYASWKNSRLLRDFEWQYVAAGKENYIYPWGDKFIKNYCNYEGTKLTPVDNYPEGRSPFGLMDLCGNSFEWVDDVIDDGMHQFTFLRGGSYFKAQHFWHTDGGARPNPHHLKFQLLNEGQNRCGTISFRIVKEI